MKQDAILITSLDNVATALRDMEAGQACHFLKGEQAVSVVVQDAIVYGHKFAVVDILKGADIIKYGEVMGRATADIPRGAHAHVQNIESLRGRGDLKHKGGT
ncbi:UxaA family hydrolase [Sediminispirochaeta bajacaliforniensis]|uniref:UxaA family hydrolase n=1 Tax=Sediminispirochaeta bajacaliforniensis TaxID=148 RepID=UPI00036D491A|nr:UxaA family hydrolase [Sediminispirochaeta bajacaliforniensis]